MEHPTNGRKFSVATGKFVDERAAANGAAESSPAVAAPEAVPEAVPEAAPEAVPEAALTSTTAPAAPLTSA
eukprot:6967350-Prymnesium_polylepis.1